MRQQEPARTIGVGQLYGLHPVSKRDTRVEKRDDAAYLKLIGHPPTGKMKVGQVNRHCADAVLKR